MSYIPYGYLSVDKMTSLLLRNLAYDKMSHNKGPRRQASGPGLLARDWFGLGDNTDPDIPFEEIPLGAPGWDLRVSPHFCKPFPMTPERTMQLSCHMLERPLALRRRHHLTPMSKVMEANGWARDPVFNNEGTVVPPKINTLVGRRLYRFRKHCAHTPSKSFLHNQIDPSRTSYARILSPLRRFAWETHPLKPVMDYSEFLNRFRTLRALITYHSEWHSKYPDTYKLGYYDLRGGRTTWKCITDKAEAMSLMKSEIEWAEREFNRHLKYLRLWRIFDSKEMWEGVQVFPDGSSSNPYATGKLDSKGRAASMLWLKSSEWKGLSLDDKLDALVQGKRLGRVGSDMYVNFDRWWVVCETFLKKGMADVYCRWHEVKERCEPALEAYVTGKIKRKEMLECVSAVGVKYYWYYDFNPFVDYMDLYEELSIKYREEYAWLANCVDVLWNKESGLRPERNRYAKSRPANVLVRLPDEVLAQLGEVVVQVSGGRRQVFKLCEVSGDKSEVWRCSRTQCNGAWVGVVYRLPKGVKVLPTAVRNILRDAGYRVTQMVDRKTGRGLQVYGFQCP